MAAFARNVMKLVVVPNMRRMQLRGYAEPATSGLPLTFGCPGQVFYNKVNVKQVDVPSYSGHFGILPHHVPVLAVFQPGVVIVYEIEGATKKYFVSSGSITVNGDSSVILNAEEACETKDLDPQACKQGLTEAQKGVGTAKDDKERAEAQIRVEVYEALVKAVEQ